MQQKTNTQHWPKDQGTIITSFIIYGYQAHSKPGSPFVNISRSPDLPSMSQMKTTPVQIKIQAPREAQRKLKTQLEKAFPTHSGTMNYWYSF